jgi:hypothetical protein
MAGDASMNDYEGFDVVLRQERGGWWRVDMTHLASGRAGYRRARTRRECEEEMRVLAVWLADPEKWYATLGER